MSRMLNWILGFLKKRNSVCVGDAVNNYLYIHSPHNGFSVICFEGL